MLFVGSVKAGMPVFFSRMRQMARQSVAIMWAICEGIRQIKRGCSSLAAAVMSAISLLSLPRMASCSVRAETKIWLGSANQRGSSCVVYVELQPDGSWMTIMPPSS